MVMTGKNVEMIPEMDERGPRKAKRVSVSSKRQISIPKEFFDELEIEKEIIMELRGNQLVIKPIHEADDDFSSDILKDLIEEGYGGEELLREFKHRKSQLRPALNQLVNETMKTGSKTVDELFRDDE